MTRRRRGSGWPLGAGGERANSCYNLGMAEIAIRVRAGQRVERHALRASEILIGSDGTADLIIDDDSVAARHAHVLVRRGRLLLVDAGTSDKGVRVGQQRIRAPVVLCTGDVFELGDVQLGAWLTRDASMVGETIAGHPVVGEIDPVELGTRRYRVLVPGGGHAEMTVLASGLDEALVERWYERSHAAAALTVAHFPPIVAHGAIRDRPYLIEAVPGGVRGTAVVGNVAQDGLHIPVEAVVLIGAQAAAAAMASHQSWGAHGAIEPRLIQLGLDGSVTLLRPGPAPGSYDDPERRLYLSWQRRHGRSADLAGDAWAVGQLIADLLGPRQRSDWPAALEDVVAPLRATDPADRCRALAAVAGTLAAIAHDTGLDPSTHHVARIARLLAPSLAKPLATRSRTPPLG